MAWNPYEQPVDYVLLAQQKSPGLATVGGAALIRQWDKIKGYGVSGSFNIFKGADLSEFTVSLRFFTPEHWAAWATWKRLVDKLPSRRGGSGKDTGNLDIWHPLLEDVAINAVCVAKRHQPEQTGDGEWTVKIDFMQFRRPKLTLAKPEGAAATPVDPVEENIIKPLLDEFQSLANP